MVNIIFYGDLRSFGKVFKLDVANTSEAFRALFHQIDGFQKKISKGGYFIRSGGQNVAETTVEKDLSKDLKDGDFIHVVPEAAGGGKFGSLVLGAVLIAASVFVPAAGISILGATITSGSLFIAGAGLVLGGVAQALTKQPSFSTENNSASKSNSSSFSSLSNSTAQGSCVPVAYGEIMIGSKVISQSLKSVKASDVKSDEKQIVSVKKYHTPVSNGGFVIDALDDSVKARSYTMVNP